MALCPNAPNPSAKIVEGIQLAETWGVPNTINVDVLAGDYTVAGKGTRNFGTGKIQLYSIPPKATVLDALLIYNTYQSNNLPAPTVTLKKGNGPATAVGGTLYGLCGSTCW